MTIGRQIVVELIETTFRKHRRSLDNETLFLAWPYKIAAEADRLGLLNNKENLLIDFIREKMLRRQAELAAARWYADN